MGDLKLALPNDSDLVHLDDPPGKSNGEHPLRGKITQWWIDALNSAGVLKIQGRTVKNVAPNNGDLLTWVAANSDWEPVAPAVLGAWTAFTTTITPTGGMTWTASSQDCAYEQQGKTVRVRIRATGTPGGAFGGTIWFSLPVNPKAVDQVLASYINVAGSSNLSAAPIVSGGGGGPANTVRVGNASGLFSGSSTEVIVEGVYEAA